MATMRIQSFKDLFTSSGPDQLKTPSLSRAQRLAKVAPPIVAEALEQRRMLSVSTSSAGDILTVTGDSNANKIDVWFDGDSINVWVNNTPHSSFNDNALTNQLIVVYGGAGNDTINCYGGEDVYNVPFPCRLYGEDGNDSIEGSDNADIIYGGAGYDTVRSWDAADSVFGGSGFGDNDDSVAGDDLLYGDAGNDVIRGEGA